MQHLKYNELPKGKFYIGTNTGKDPFIIPDWWVIYYDEDSNSYRNYIPKPNSIMCIFQSDFDDYISCIGYKMYQEVIIDEQSHIAKRCSDSDYIVDKYTISEPKPLDQCPHITNPQSLFLYYIRTNNFPKMKELYYNPKVEVEYPTEIDGDTPLEQARYVGNIDMIHLLQQKRNIDCGDIVTGDSANDNKDIKINF